VPLRLVVSERNLKENKIEWKNRFTGESGTMDRTDVKAWVSFQIAAV